EREIKKLKLGLSATPVTEKGAKAARVSAWSSAGADSAERLEKYLGVAKGEISRLDYIVTQFLQAIRPVPPQPQLPSVNHVVRETLDLLRPEIENRGVTVKEKLARQLPFCRMDPGQIKQALVNLIKNAIQAMTKGGVLTLQTDSGVD